MEIASRPYQESNIRLVTSSRTEQGLANYYGINIEPDIFKRTLVTKGEQHFDEVRNNGIIVPHHSDKLPYPISVALAKATALKPTLDSGQKEINHKHAVTDSGQVVVTHQGCFVLGKPNAHKDGIEVGICELTKFYMQHKGNCIVSETGVVVFDGRIEHIYLFQLEQGKINPKLDIERLTNYMRNNPGVAGGVDALGGWRNGIFIPENFVNWKLKELQNSSIRTIAGGLVYDGVNSQSFQGLANGIIR